MARARPWPTPKGKTWEVQGFYRVRDTRSAPARDEEMMAIINGRPEDPTRPSRILCRPGFLRLVTSGGTHATIAGGTGTTSDVLVARTTGAALRTLVVRNGGIYSIGFDGVITTELSAAQISSAGCAALGDIVNMIAFRGKIIVATGSGKPWVWTGTTGGAPTPISNAPDNCLSPTIYARKLLFRVKDTPNIYWSEEDDETTGYESGGYSNTWPLGDSGTFIEDLVGLESGLFYWRRGSERGGGIGIITGRVNSDFQTSATRDSISETIGMSTARAYGLRACVADRRVAFVDQFNRPHILTESGDLIAVYEQLPRSCIAIFGRGPATNAAESHIYDFLLEPTYLSSGISTNEFSTCSRIDHDPLTGGFLFSYKTVGTTVLSIAPDGRFLGWWRVGTATADFESVVVYRNGQIATYLAIDSSGRVWGASAAPAMFTTTLSPRWYDEDVDGSKTRVPITVITPAHGWSTDREYAFTGIDVIHDVRGANMNIDIDYVTSALHKGSLTGLDDGTLNGNVTGTGGVYPYEYRSRFGTDGMGRWARYQIRLSSAADDADSPPSLHGYKVRATVIGDGGDAQ